METKKPWCTGQDQHVPLSSKALSASYQFSSLWNCAIRCDSSVEMNVPPAHFPVLWDLPKFLAVNLMLLSSADQFLTQASHCHPLTKSFISLRHWREEWDELSTNCNSISCPQTQLWSSKFSKSSFCLAQPCWRGDRHRESQQSSAAQKMQIPPLLIILGSLRSFLWEPLGIWRSSCSQAVSRGISCAHWGKRGRTHPVL